MTQNRYTKDNSLIELTISEDGDLVIGPDGDIQLSYGPQALAEHIMIRLRTYLNDAAAMPNVGSQVEDLAGYPNTRETGISMEQLVLQALTRDGFLGEAEVDITAVPDSSDSITIYIDPDPGNKGKFQGVLSFQVDLSTGRIF